MRKNIWLFIALTVLFGLSCSRGTEIRVSGIIEQNESAMIYLDELGLSEIRKVDSTKIKRDGSFILKDRIEVPTFYNLHLGDQKIIPLLIKPGDHAEVSTSYKDFARSYEINGSRESLQLLNLNQQLAKTRYSLDSLTRVFEENLGSGEETLTAIQAVYAEVLKSQRRYSIGFILENMTSMASIYALYQKIDETNYVLNSDRDIQLLKITSAALDTIYPESEYVKSLKTDAANQESEIYNRSLQRLVDGAESILPEIRLPDPYGDTMALSSLNGKVILLSFWASWNEASINLNQEFKNLYSKYHDRGLEIYQVSFDSELSSWMNAILFDELPWINVSELSYPESVVAMTYNIDEIPGYFLIDRQGQIVGKNMERIILDRKIENLINKD